MIDVGLAVVLTVAPAGGELTGRPQGVAEAPHLLDAPASIPMDLSPEEQLEFLLQQRRLHPHQAHEIDAEIQHRFLQTHAILILDMAGLTSTTQDAGIIPALEDVFHLREIASPVLADYQGRLLKAEADNIYGVFDHPDSAMGSAEEILRRLADVGLVASIGIGYGEVLTVGERNLYGDQMNLTSRLGEDLAEANEILLTESAYAALSHPAWQFTPGQTIFDGHCLRFYRFVWP